MNVLMLSRELNSGEYVSDYCMDIMKTLYNINFFSIFYGREDNNKIKNNIYIFPTDIIVHANNFFNWVILLNNEFKRRGREIIEKNVIDVIHANDWTTVPASIAISDTFSIPMILTLHSTENMRGFSEQFSNLISHFEWLGCYHARKVIVRDNNTYWSIINNLNVPKEKIVFCRNAQDIKKVYMDMIK